MNEQAFERISAVLRELTEVDGSIRQAGLAVPQQLAQVAALLGRMRANHGLRAAKPEELETPAQPVPPPINLPPDLQARWDSWVAFFTAICEFFGWPNSDQYLMYAQIAAILAQRGAALPDGPYLPLAGGTLTGSLVINTTNPNDNQLTLEGAQAQRILFGSPVQAYVTNVDGSFEMGLGNVYLQFNTNPETLLSAGNLVLVGGGIQIGPFSTPPTGTPGTVGLVIYNTTLNKLQVYTGSKWETIQSS